MLDARLSEPLAKPRTNKHVFELIKEHSYSPHVKARAGNFEIETDDDEMDLCQYFFDSKFESANPNRVTFLTTQKWLPTKIDSTLKSRPCTYVAARYPSQTCDSCYWDFWKLSGHRLDRIGEICARMEQTEGQTDCHSLIEFLSTITTDTGWNVVVEGLANDKRFANESTSLKCEEHICQLNHHEQTWVKNKVFCQLIVFDDFWAKTHPVIFRSLKRMRHGDILFGKQPRITVC